MHHLLRKKVNILLLLLLLAGTGSSQGLFSPNQEGHDSRPYHFGINVGYNRSHFSFSHHPQFLRHDSIMGVESLNSSGINLAWLVNFRISNHFDLRIHPVDLTFSEKAFLYTQNYESDTSVTKKLQSITLSFPAHLKFSSDRIKNLKVYTIVGGKFDYDLASNKGASQAEDLVKLNRRDLSAELGLGFHFYFPYFVLSPEIKISHGLLNLHSRDVDLKYSNVIDRISSKMITFSLTVE